MTNQPNNSAPHLWISSGEGSDTFLGAKCPFTSGLIRENEQNGLLAFWVQDPRAYSHLCLNHLVQPTATPSGSEQHQRHRSRPVGDAAVAGEMAEAPGIL